MTIMERVRLDFGYDPEILEDVGVDPRTSEGKRKIRDLLVAALAYYADAGEGQLDDEDLAIAEALTVEL